jgi:hypothetical protein
MSFIQNITGDTASYGVIYDSNTFTGLNFSYTTSYKELTSLPVAFGISSTAQDFAMSTDGRLKYTGVVTKRFSVSAGFSSVASGSHWIALQLYKNGSGLTDSTVYGVTAMLISCYEVTLSTNDYLSLFVKAQSGFTANIKNIILSACSIGRV